MAFAQGSRSRTSYKVESTFGTAATGTYAELPINTHSLNLQKGRVQGNEIHPDRMPRTDRHGNRQTNGDIVVDLRANIFDELLAGLMFSSWDNSPSSAPDELKVGTTLKSFSIEDYLEDIDQARLFTGQVVSQASFSIKPDQMVSTTFSFMGEDMSVSATELTTSAPTILQPFDSHSGAVTIADNGGSLAAIATVLGIDFTVNNNLNPTFVVGADVTPQMEYGRAEVEGTLTAYIEDATLWNRFINETETALKVTVDDPTGANEYGFFFPRIKINAADSPLADPQSRKVTLPFVALYDATEESNLTMYRPDTT